MSNNNNKFITEALLGFQQNKGKASISCFPPLDVAQLVANVIFNYRRKRPDTTILIVVDKFPLRLKIAEAATALGVGENIRILSDTYINEKYSYNYNLIITINLFDINCVKRLNSCSIFMFYIFTRFPNDNEFLINVRSILPEINTSVKTNDALIDKVNSPVEEYRVEVPISDEDREQYNKCNLYISDSMKVFGDLSVVEKCRIGDVENNISAAEYRYNLAIENNWSETLDTTIEINKQIDEIYNPNTILERATIVYNIFRERRNLLVDNEAKLSYIGEIIKDNPNKKILIVNCRGEFANKITDYINNAGIGKCANYHDDIESQYLNDENGNPIRYKSGENKGKLKIFGSQSLSTFAQNLFVLPPSDSQSINCLSIKCTSDRKLKIAIDLIIFTSSYCTDFPDFISRFNNIDFKTPIKTYKLYCADTIEYTNMLNKPIPHSVKIMTEEKNIQIDENNGDIIL